MNDATEVRQRHLGDAVTIAAGVSAIGTAVAISGILPGRVDETHDGAALTVAIGGLMAIVGLLLAQRTPSMGRAVIALAGLALVAAPLLFGRGVAWVWMLEIVLGVVLLAASAFVGRMPVDVP